MRQDKVREFGRRIAEIRSASAPRGRGNTDLVLQGASNYGKKFAFISLSAKEAIRVSKLSGNENFVPMSIHLLGANGLVPGMPVIFDSSAIDHIMEEVEAVLDTSIDRKNAMEVTDGLMRCCEEYQKRCHETEKLITDIRFTKWWQFRKRYKLRKKLYKMVDDNVKHSPIEKLFFKTQTTYDVFYKFDKRSWF